MKRIQLTGIAFVLALLYTVSACSKQEIPTFDSKNALWFEERYSDDEQGGWVYLNDVEISATFYPGQTEFIQSFPLNLIGPQLSSPKEYDIVLIDSLSQAGALEYIVMPEVTEFKANVVRDSLFVKILIGEIPEGYTGYATYTLVENENFREGYIDNQRIKITVNNVPTRPLWWGQTIEQVYLGTYSKEKFAAFIQCTGLTALEGMDALEMRNICRQFKKYVEDNELKEANGSDMIIPIY